MLCPSVFQATPAAMRPFLELHWPIRSLWPETRPLFYQMEQEMIRHMQEMRQRMEYMERLHQKIFEINQTFCSAGALKPIAFQELGRDGDTFALSLDTTEFAPQELSVKQVGRKLWVSGRTEKKQDGKGSYSYRRQEFRQGFDLPEGIDPETVSCSLVRGRLQIQAPLEKPPSDGKERIIPINVTSAPAITSKNSSPPAESSPAEKN